MTLSSAFQVALLAAAFLITTVFGILLVFAIVVMPGIAHLDDGAYLRAFQVIDGVIQNKQPIFYIVWIGAAVALVTTTALGVAGDELGRESQIGLVLVTVAHVATQVATVTINIPLNNRVQELTIGKMGAFEKQQERSRFENKWCFWNNVRTIINAFVSVYLLYLLLVEQCSPTSVAM